MFTDMKRGAARHWACASRRAFGLATVAAIAAGIASGARAQTATPEPQCHIYAALFQVTVDTAGHIVGLSLDRVVDPSGPGTEEEVARRAVRIDPPPAWLAAVRAFLETRDYSGNPSIFFTYAFYNPARPTEPNPDPRGCEVNAIAPR